MGITPSFFGKLRSIFCQKSKISTCDKLLQALLLLASKNCLKTLEHRPYIPVPLDTLKGSKSGNQHDKFLWKLQ